MYICVLPEPQSPGSSVYKANDLILGRTTSLYGKAIQNGRDVPMNCPRCGKQVSDEAVYCPYCREPLKATGQSSDQSETGSSTQSSSKLYLRLEIELDSGANPSMDEIISTVKELLSIGEQGMGREPQFGVRSVTPL
jgi:hypothetical protein